MLNIQWFCSYISLIQWLQNHLLTCPFKYLTGIDCPGCGFQRSCIALLKGDLSQSIRLYPSTIPLMLALAFTLADGYFKFDSPAGVYKKTIYCVTGSIILISYVLKLTHVIA